MTTSHPCVDRVAHRNLVFTSAGERSNVRQWLVGRKNFDLWVTDYGYDGNEHADIADFHNARAGKKFPNLAHVFASWPDIVARYDAIFVVDDDLELDATAISKLFDIRAEHDLLCLQPAFLPNGAISHEITRNQPKWRLRWTNFVEVVCPLFQRAALDRFMAVYDPQLVGWGVDWWYLDVLGPDLRGKIAIVDEVPCVNPCAYTKGKRLETDEPRYAKYARNTQLEIWREFRARHEIRSESRGFMTYDRLPQLDTVRRLQATFRYAHAMTLGQRYRVAPLLKRGLRRLSQHSKWRQ